MLPTTLRQNALGSGVVPYRPPAWGPLALAADSSCPLQLSTLLSFSLTDSLMPLINTGVLFDSIISHGPLFFC